MGVKVINILVIVCLFVVVLGDQWVLGVVLWYVVIVKDVVIVVVVGNDGEVGCGNNLMYDLLDLLDFWDWYQVMVVLLLLWFFDYVLLVGVVDVYGVVLDKSMLGLWVGVVVLGIYIMGLLL